MIERWRRPHYLLRFALEQAVSVDTACGGWQCELDCYGGVKAGKSKRYY